jgi:hypothetical protein
VTVQPPKQATARKSALTRALIPATTDTSTPSRPMEQTSAICASVSRLAVRARTADSVGSSRCGAGSAPRPAGSGGVGHSHKLAPVTLRATSRSNQRGSVAVMRAISLPSRRARMPRSTSHRRGQGTPRSFAVTGTRPL